MPRLQLAGQGALLLHAALQPGQETEHQPGPPGQGDKGPSLSPGLATTAAGRTGHLGTEMMRDLTKGAAIIMIKAPLQEEQEDNPPSSYEQTNPAQLINNLSSTLRILGLTSVFMDNGSVFVFVLP